jgi:hypothetical protein
LLSHLFYCQSYLLHFIYCCYLIPCPHFSFWVTSPSDVTVCEMLDCILMMRGLHWKLVPIRIGNHKFYHMHFNVFSYCASVSHTIFLRCH